MDNDEEQKCNINKPGASMPLDCQSNSNPDIEEENTKG